MAGIQTKEDELSAHVDCQPLADSQIVVLGEFVPVANRVDTGVVIGGDCVQGVAPLHLVYNADRLGGRRCCGTMGVGAL